MIISRKTIILTSSAIMLTAMMVLTACTKEAKNDTPSSAITAPPPVSSNATTNSENSDGKISQLQREAQDGDPDAQYNLAYRYENGLDVPKDPTKALELYKSAADQGHSAARASIDAMNKAAK